MSDIASILENRKLRSISRSVVFDEELLGRIEQLRRDVETAKRAEASGHQGLASNVPSKEAELLELSSQAADIAVTFTVAAIRADELAELKRQAPPDKSDLERYREQVKLYPLATMPEFNTQKLAPLLLAAAVTEPEMSVEQAAELWNGSSLGTQDLLWSMVWSVQQGGPELPFSATATAVMRDGGRLSTTPQS